MSDITYMQRALELADAAAKQGEVPVGAVLVNDTGIIGEGHNSPISACDPSAHAEINALRMAGKALGNYRLPNTTLYVTLEPCSMCAGAIVHARVERLVIAAREPRAGAAGSVLNIVAQPSFNHQTKVEFGLLETESANLLKRFFKAKRDLAKQAKQNSSAD